jgi:CheY-like chemotaxis protein
LNITVADTGIGIPEDEVEAIFDEFTQVDSSTTRKAGGTGLGLPITKKFVELHHGRIFVRSKVNYGSSFTVQLPLKPQQDKELEESPPEPELKISPEINQQPIILAVDDDPQVLKLYERYLRNKPMELVGLSDSMQAVSQAKELQPFAILLDVLMPEKDGWRVISELKENPYTTHIPIIICSIVDDKYKANSLDVAGYLTKPILEKDLLDALETLSKHPRTKRVLIIDDHADDILLSRRILEARACQVIEASSGPEGLEIVYNYPPDLIILDLTMPGMDGFEVMDALKTDAKIRNIPVIVITARDLNASEREKIIHHADALLTTGRFLDSDLLKDVDPILQPEFA